MKGVTSRFLFYLLCFLSLLIFFGCDSDTEEDAEKTTSLIAERPEPEKTDHAPIYIPDKWYKTRDPLLRNNYFHTVLINQFGDMPEVHTIAGYQRKRIQGLHVSRDEYNTYLDALKHLWPARETPQKLGVLEETNDPEVFAKLFSQQLIEQFGDVPEIDIIVKVEKKVKAGESIPLDEFVDYAHALFQLFPSEQTLRQFQGALAEQEKINGPDHE